jgi:hypothetical protein
LALLAVMLAVAPWGNYPLNDDWQYALAARHYARTNLIRIDTAIAPSLVGQLVMAWPFMKVFGFSHRLLRLLTLAMAFFVLWVCDALLTEWEVPRRVRLRVLLVLALNPLFVNLATSFMTEFYGYAPALAGALIWQRGRRHAQADGASPVIRWGAAAWAGALVGVTFWTRQYCIVVYPALVGATAGRLALARDWRRLALSWWPMLAGTVAFAATIGGYIVWAKHYGWLKPAFLGPLEHVLDVDPVSLNLGAGVQLVYLSVYLLPLLVSWPVSRHDWQRAIRPCLVTLGFGITIYSLIQLAAPSDAGALGIHRVFPFNSNLIHTRGLGPVTLTDEFYLGADPYLIRSRAFWRGVTYVVIGASILWGLPVATAGAWRGTSTSRLEGLAFSAAFVGLSLAAILQAYGRDGFDRYGFPLVIGVAFLLAILLARSEEASGGPRPRSLRANGLYAIALAPIAFFTVAGAHDYFRWNDARWSLVERARRLGVPSTSIDGGYEANGWLSFEQISKHQESIETSACIGTCQCDLHSGIGWLWNCYDDSYRVGTVLRDEYQEIARIQPHYWFGAGPPLILSKRPK